MESIPGFQIVADAADGLEAIDKAALARPDILLLDIGMPRLNGLKAAEVIRVVSPGTKIIFVTQEQDEDIRLAALATGAEGYVVKSKAASELMMTVDAALHKSAHCCQATVPDVLPVY
jgi:DNA-binding NarL/FixJ family response regulator